MQKELGRDPSKYEIIEKLGISDDDFNYWEKAFEANTLQSLDQAYDEFSFLYASHLNDPETTLQDKELKNQIRKALGILNQREAMVAQLYYVEEVVLGYGPCQEKVYQSSIYQLILNLNSLSYKQLSIELKI